MSQGMKTHPAADIFPLIDGPDFDALVEDIRQHGQQVAILMAGDQILDGRNRWRACMALGREPRTLQWDGIGGATDRVVSLNLRRRHLTESQRAMIAGRLATLAKGRPATAPKQTVEISTAFEPIDFKKKSAQEAANLMNVSRHSVVAARHVLKHGTAAEVAAADSGVAPVSAIAKAIKAGQTPEQRAYLLLPQRRGVNGRKIPDAPTDRRMASACAMIRDANDSIEALLLRDDAATHPDRTEWASTLAEERTRLSRHIKQCRGGLDVE